MFSKYVDRTDDPTPTSVLNDEVIPGLTVYPNPTIGILNVNVPSGATTSFTVSTVQGVTVKEFSSETQSVRISTQDLSKGMYIITATNKDGVWTQSFSVQ